MAIKFISSSKMRKIDSLATAKFGIPSLILMENAGRSIADQAENMLKNRCFRITIFCGYGNNGGDGFVAARHLANRGYNVVIYVVGEQKKMSKDTKMNFDIINKMKIMVRKITNPRQINIAIRQIGKRQLIIDAVFGIGLKGRLDTFYCYLFKKINSTNIPILSIDIPSGLDADRGIPLPIAIKAKRTITMGLAKKGFMNPLAKRCLGKVIIADISLPKQLK